MSLHREEIGGKAVFLADYRIHYQYKNWIGKPDPSGMGTAYIVSEDVSWIHDKCLRLESGGDKVIAVEKWNRGTGKWRKI